MYYLMFSVNKYLQNSFKLFNVVKDRYYNSGLFIF